MNYYDKAISFDSLYHGLKKSCRNVRWKDSVVGYEANGLRNTLKLSKALKSGTYRISPYQKFVIFEPKRRDIVATRLVDRQFQRSLCDSGLYEDITQHFIRDNVACQVGKGTDYAISRLKLHLRRYYSHYDAEGWALKCDIHHFFESIPHWVAKKAIRKYVSDTRAADAVIDVVHSFDDGRGYGLGLGSQISQLVALLCLTDFDHFVKERLGIKYYIRYMDDFILIHYDREYLKYCLNEIHRYLGSIELELNDKTSLFPLRNGINFMKWRFVLTDTGKVVMLMDRSKITKEKRRIRKLLAKEERGEVPERTARTSLESWLANVKRGNTIRKQHDMINYYTDQKEKLYYARQQRIREETGTGIRRHDGTGSRD